MVNVSHYTDKKDNKIYLIYKEIQKGAVAKSYMTNSLLTYDFETAPYEEHFLFFFSVYLSFIYSYYFLYLKWFAAFLFYILPLNSKSVH